MKAIIYAGIGLFSAATVYGIADYYGTKNSGTLDKIYKEEEPVAVSKKETVTTTALPVANNAVTTTEANTKTLVVKANKKKTVKRSQPERIFKASDFSRGRIRPPKVVEDKTVDVVVEKEENK